METTSTNSMSAVNPHTMLEDTSNWTIEYARLEDAPRLAHIQISAFKSNALFKVQFPSSEAFEGYQKFLAQRIKDEIEGAHATVLVIRKPKLEKVGYQDESAIAFAIWRPPHPGEEADLNAKKEWPKGTNVDMIRTWGEKVNAAYATAMGDQECYRLDWLVTDKSYEGQGAGSVLLEWGLNTAEDRQLPVYLESTMESEKWYLRRGFKRVVEFSTQLDSDNGVIYQEVGLLWRHE